MHHCQTVFKSFSYRTETWLQLVRIDWWTLLHVKLQAIVVEDHIETQVKPNLRGYSQVRAYTSNGILPKRIEQLVWRTGELTELGYIVSNFYTFGSVEGRSLSNPRNLAVDVSLDKVVATISEYFRVDSKYCDGSRELTNIYLPIEAVFAGGGDARREFVYVWRDSRSELDESQVA